MIIVSPRISVIRLRRASAQAPLLQLVICTALAIALTLFLADRVVYALPAQPIPTTVDTTEDPKAMGYPDGRKVARDGAGNLYVAYRKKYKSDQQTAYHIFVAKSMDNGRSWLTLNQGRPIEGVGDQNQRVPAIAVDSRGTIHVVWYGKDGNDYGSDENQIKYVRSTDQGRTWSAWRNIAYVAGYLDQPLWQEHPTLYIDHNDLLYIAWEGSDPWHSDSAQVKFIRSADGGQNWSLWKNVAPSATNHSRPTIVGNRQDSLYILAYGRAGNKQQIIYTRSTDGGISWSSWARVAPSSVEQRHVSAATDSQGTLHIVWRQQPLSLFSQLGFNNKHAKTQIHYASFDGASWSTPESIPSNHNAAQTFPSIGVATNERANPATGERGFEDTVWIVWSETLATNDYPNDTLESGEIYAVAKRDQGWSSPTMLATGNNNIYASVARAGGSVAGNRNGAIDVVWLDNQQSFKQIRFAQLTNLAYGVSSTSAPLTHLHGLLSIQPLQESMITINAVDAPYWLHIGFATFLLNPQLAREMQTLILIVVAVTVYVLLKFMINRWFTTLLNYTVDR